MAMTSLVVRDGNSNRNQQSHIPFECLESSGVIRGYHVYQRIWTLHVGEKATMVRELGNEYDRFAIAVFEDETLCTVGHLLWEIYRIAFTGFSNYASYF